MENKFGFFLNLQDGQSLCPRCGGSGVDPVPNDPTNQCGNALMQRDRRLIDTGVPICRSCGSYGTVPRSAA